MRYAKLIMVAVSDGTDPKKASQSNKYYEMKENGSNFDVTYGRVESTAIHESYPIHLWTKKYNEKLKKGYKDVTHTVQVKVPTSVDTTVKLDKITDDKVDRFLTLMKKYTDGLVAKTYTVKAQNVTQEQVDNAQDFINKLTKVKKTDVKEINSLLLELYMEIPRFMGNVKDYLLPSIDLTKTLQQEQDNLDALASQVKALTPTKVSKSVKKEAKTLLDVLGITMKEIKAHKDLDYLIKQLTGRKIDGLFEIQKADHDKIFDSWMTKQKNKDTRIVIHGTRNSSVIPIIEQGLKIRPQGNYQFSGKVYGDSNYFSETCTKSLGYTGYDPDQILLVYEIHIGNPYTYNGWYTGNSFKLCYEELQKRGYESLFVKAGNGLLNSEICCYKEEQSRLKYIIHLKR